MSKFVSSFIRMAGPLLMLFLLSPANPIFAADITVDSNCSLADAIQAAESDSEVGGCPAGSGADTIHLTSDITLTAELPQITSAITIEGGGYAISGDNSFRIFFVASGKLALDQLTLTNGSARKGGAINNEGVLKINDSNFSDNTAKYFGGAIYNDGMLAIIDCRFDDNRAEIAGGAIVNESSLSIADSSFSNNYAGSAGGAIADIAKLSITNSRFTNNSAALMGGGAISSNRELNISDSSFRDNSADNGEGGALRILTGQANIVNSAFVGNSAEKGGGAINNAGYEDFPNATVSVRGSAFAGNQSKWGGGAISSNDYGSLDIRNSSFTNNQANLFGGAVSSLGEFSVANSTFASNMAESIAGAILVFSDGTPTLAHLTVANNLSNEGGGIFVLHKDTALNLYNSLIFGNDGGDCSGQLNQNLGNLIEDGSCDPAISGDPLLGALVEPEDGSPAYFPLLPDSAAIDAADPEHCAATDQTGAARPQGDGCDIGAVEFTHE